MVTSDVISKDTLRAIRLLEAFRELDAEMQSQTVLTFLYVMDTPGISMTELAQRIGYSQASTSRNVAALSEWHRAGRPGANLLRAVENPQNRREKLVWLTQRGQQFARRVRELMQ